MQAPCISLGHGQARAKFPGSSELEPDLHSLHPGLPVILPPGLRSQQVSLPGLPAPSLRPSEELRPSAGGRRSGPATGLPRSCCVTWPSPTPSLSSRSSPLYNGNTLQFLHGPSQGCWAAIRVPDGWSPRNQWAGRPGTQLLPTTWDLPPSLALFLPEPHYPLHERATAGLQELGSLTPLDPLPGPTKQGPSAAPERGGTCPSPHSEQGRAGLEPRAAAACLGRRSGCSRVLGRPAPASVSSLSSRGTESTFQTETTRLGEGRD